MSDRYECLDATLSPAHEEVEGGHLEEPAAPAAPPITLAAAAGMEVHAVAASPDATGAPIESDGQATTGAPCVLRLNNSEAQSTGPPALADDAGSPHAPALDARPDAPCHGATEPSAAAPSFAGYPVQPILCEEPNERQEGLQASPEPTNPSTASVERVQERDATTAPALPEAVQTQAEPATAREALPTPPHWLGTHLWPLPPARLSVHRCPACASLWLQPSACCGAALHDVQTPYYIAASSPPTAAPPDFSIIMLTKNHLALTRAAVESLRRARGGHPVEFVFVDSGSTDGSLNYFRDLAAIEAVQLIVTHPDEPFVTARNLNRGAQVARGQFLLLANNDIEVRDPDLLPKLARGLADPRVGAVGTRTDYDCGNELQQQGTLPAERVWSAKPVMGFLWAVRADLFAELGGLDEAFCDYGCDEIDFQYRAIQRNYRLSVVDSLVHHAVHATFGSDVVPGLLRNIDRFNAKHGRQLVEGGRWYAPFLAHSYPRVSVAIACRNHGAYLPRALDSVLASYLPTGTGLQVVVVNDASTDDTAAVLEQYRLRCPGQVNAIHRARSLGPAVAKNQALRRCVGDYTALLDADDDFLEYKLWRCLDTLDDTGADFLYHDLAYVFPDGRQERRQVGPWDLQRWREGHSLPTNTWFFRSGTVLFSEAFVTGEDPEFLRRRWESLTTTYLPELLARYHVHGSSLSQRAMCRVVTGQLKGLEYADVGGCTDIPALPAGR